MRDVKEANKEKVISIQLSCYFFFHQRSSIVKIISILTFLIILETSRSCALALGCYPNEGVKTLVLCMPHGMFKSYACGSETSV